MFNIKLTNHNFRINNKFEYIRNLCKNYIVDDDISALEISANAEERAFENQDGGNWSDSYLESLAVYRKICENLIFDDIILFHCSALALDENGYLFTGPSGTGKSTHAKLWRKYFKNRIITVNDDKPLIEFTKDEIRVYGTPYGGKGNLQTNTSAKVKGIVVLKQAKENSMRRLSENESFPVMLSQTYRPESEVGTIKTLDLVTRLVREIPIWELSCTISKEAVELCYKNLSERK